MAVTKISISLEPLLAKEIRREARLGHRKVSTWVAEVIREHLRQRHAAAALETFEADHGPITDEELTEARKQWPFPG